MGLPANIIGIMGKRKYLPLTTAWIAATLETDTTILNALNTFEAGLIANSLTGKFNAIYPFVGGDSTKHTFNFINTATFALTFTGGWTHAATGALPNGTNAFANTGLAPSTTLSLNDAHLSAYLRTNTNAGIDVGCAITANTTQLGGRLTGNYFGNINQSSNSIVANAISTGHYLASRTAVTTNNGYKNGASILASTVVSTIRPTTNLYLGARNSNGTADNYSARELAFASVGSGLTAGEASTLYTLIQAMQTSLFRNV
jgi:hypothetical protein